MFSIITGSILLSILHAAIPSHWLPIIAIGKKEHWDTSEMMKVTLVAALAHALSTIAIGMVLGSLGKEIAEHVTVFTHFIAPAIFIALGLYFIYRHHTHSHRIQDIVKKRSKKRIVIALVAAMFFSPCMEIEAYFLLAGTLSASLVALIAALYLVITTVGMVTVVWLAHQGLLKINRQHLEHNAGIIAGITLIVTGIASFFIA